MSHDDLIINNGQIDLPSRRKFLRNSILLASAAGASGMLGGFSAGAWAAGSDAPEKKQK